MNIKFYTLKFKAKDGEHTRASRRFRATIPLKGMRKNDGQIENLDLATRDDIIILAKDTSIKDGQFLLDNNIKFVFDICDDKWGSRKSKLTDTYNFLCKNANLVTTSTPTLANIIHRHTGIHAHVITDPVERERKEPEFKNILNDTTIKFAYYGAGKNFEVIDWNKIVNDLKVAHNNNKIEIHVVIGRANKHLGKVQHLIEQKILFAYQWTYELQDQIVDDCHFVLLPIVNVNENISAKSPNRLIDGIQRGKLVLTNSGVDSYEKFKNFSYFVPNFNYGKGLLYAINNKDEVLTNIKRGQLYIDQNHTPDIVGKKWIEIERLV
jgi:hypothetical protein